MAAVRQEAVADEGEVQDARNQHGDAYGSVHEEAGLHAHFLQGVDTHQVAGCADDGQIAAQRSGEDQRHQQPGAGVAGLVGDAADHGNQHGGGAGVGQEAGHDADDNHDRHDEHPLGFGEPGDQTADFVGHAGFKQGLTHNEHTHAQDDVAVDITGKGCGIIQNAGEVQADGHDGGGQTQGDFFQNEADNGEGQEDQRNGTGTHGISSVSVFLMLSKRFTYFVHYDRIQM